MENNTVNYTEKAINAIAKIADAEPEFFVALSESLDHIAGTYGDKYEGSKGLIDTKAQLYHPTRGAAINPYQIARYNQRFMSEGFKKSGNKNDMMKIIHYALFDMVRMNRIGAVKNEDVVDGKEQKMSQSEFENVEIPEVKK